MTVDLQTSQKRDIEELLDRSGWRIVDKDTSPTPAVGLRPNWKTRKMPELAAIIEALRRERT